MSWKNAAKAGQRIHKERHQPHERSHLGLLEKKKDYRERAKDANAKKDILHKLHKKALNKNEDEFFHHMIKSKIKDGEHHELEDEEKDVDSKEQKLLMQTQDLNYVNMKRVIEMKKIKKIQANYHMIDAANHFKNKHIFFVDDEEEAKNFDPAKVLGVDSESLKNKTNRKKIIEKEKIEDEEDTEDEDIDEIPNDTLKVYNELKNRIIREKELSIVQNKLLMKKTLRQKRSLKPKKIKAGTKTSAPVFQFKYERKK
ncbi:probable U3 small nucleolar RNA-associated protein 11 [Condylostylus longicornis]|uniref:probable U3 small nucleolar RNA-associated protein 11 n=1 Tax=Condylostylus longicornis TaxID=2530218 RepID=UPI00244DE7BE|nr:probable U3 small nucleolar RNA-associated protein 11 [Condylostylus longicornis]